jgi:hypothetical protein
LAGRNAVSAGSGTHPARQFFRDHFDLGVQMLTSSFEAGVAAGELRPDLDYNAIARQVIAMSEGLESQWLVDPDNVDLASMFRGYTRALRAYITV